MRIVTTYTHPDLDGVSCSFGYAEFLISQGKEAGAYITGIPQRAATGILEKIDVPSLEKLPNKTDEVILTDACFRDALPFTISPHQVVEIIDHHPDARPHEFPNLAVYQNETVGAAATLVTEKFAMANLVPSYQIAYLLYSAILDNSLLFSVPHTSEKDRTYAKWLQEIHTLPEQAEHFDTICKLQSDLHGEILSKSILNDCVIIHGLSFSLYAGQLETENPERLLHSRRNELDEILRQLLLVSSSEQSLIIMPSLRHAYTGILCSSEELAQVITKAIPGARTNQNLVSIPMRMQRKNIIPLLSKAS